MKTDSDIAASARELAKHLSWNEDEIQSEVKGTLLESAHRLDANARYACRVGLSFKCGNSLGKTRSMTIGESLMFLLFRAVPERI